MRKIKALVVDLKLNNIGSIIEALIFSGYEVDTKVNDKNIQNSDILVLPGVGEYTASAILSIAFNKPYPVLDGNVKRVISRIIGIKKLYRKRFHSLRKLVNY